jgi:hypothetical protein
MFSRRGVALGVRVQALTDARKDPSRIGENREGEDERRVLTVTRDDVPAFCTKQFETVLGELGFKIGDDTSGATTTAS